MPDSFPPCIISEDEFKTGVGAWQGQAMQANDPKVSGYEELLDTIFSKTGKPEKKYRMQYVSMPSNWVRYLISTVGCTQVKVRFMVEKNGQFALCFYATDSQNRRVSAYYLINMNSTNMGNLMAAMYGTKSESGEVSAGDGDGAVQIPHGVAGDWIRNWQREDSITFKMFTTPYGLLQGYNFERGDLANNLFDEKSNEEQQLRIDFCLHEYYSHAPEKESQATYTFGLVLRLVNPDNTTSDMPFYDLATPCPPTY